MDVEAAHCFMMCFLFVRFLQTEHCRMMQSPVKLGAGAACVLALNCSTKLSGRKSTALLHWVLTWVCLPWVSPAASCSGVRLRAAVL